MSEPLLLIGCGGHARSLIDMIETIDHWHVLGLVGLPQQVGEDVLGYPVLGSDEDLLTLRQQCPNALVAVGQITSASHRRQLSLKLADLDFTSPVIISGNAYVSRHARLGNGTCVGHGVIVNAGAAVGNHCILNSSALIEHDVCIGNYCHISTGVMVNGGVVIGSESFIGSGAVLRNGICLPPQTIISAGKRVMGWPMHQEHSQ